jgi:N-acyl-phosphatidylethanolamine-hydrolysing phospholipase D
MARCRGTPERDALPSIPIFSNSDPRVIIGNYPWYQMLWRSIRGDFRPKTEPAGGYAAFAHEWSTPVDLTRLTQRPVEPVITWLGHVSMLLQVAGLNVLIDPTLASHAGPYGRLGAARRVPAPLTPEQLPPIDVLLISHNHYDHLCGATLGRLKAAAQRPLIVVPQGLKRWFDARGFERVTELDWWEELRLAPDLKVHFTPAQHWSRRTPWDTNASHWGGYLLEWQRAPDTVWRFLFPGDTGYSADFRAIRARFGPVDFLAVPIGAYLPRDFMQPMHVNPTEAVQILLDLEARQAMAVHWGTFMLTQEAFDQPPKDLAVALSERQLPTERVWLLHHGETRALPL